MIDQSTQTFSEQRLMPFAQIKGIVKLLFSKLKTKPVFALRLGFISALLMFSMVANAATIYFNTVYKATGTSYTVNTQSLAGTQLVSGSGFRFTSINPNDVTFANGNNEAGTLSYINSSGVAVSVVGTISRQSKSGNTTLAVNLITSAGKLMYLLCQQKKVTSQMVVL